MNREIKFRGKNKDIGWVEGQVAYDLNEDTYIIREVEQDSSYGLEEAMLFAIMWYRVDKETIGQYTGLKDENGKEIYEGDIVKITGSKEIDIGKVIYEYDGFTVDVMNMDRFYGRVHLLEKFTEVIGNVFENGDILNDSKNTEKN